MQRVFTEALEALPQEAFQSPTFGVDWSGEARLLFADGALLREVDLLSPTPSAVDVTSAPATIRDLAYVPATGGVVAALQTSGIVAEPYRDGSPWVRARSELDRIDELSASPRLPFVSVIGDYLEVIDARHGGTIWDGRKVLRGPPDAVTWSPCGARLLLEIGGRTLVVTFDDGHPRELEDLAACPGGWAWGADGAVTRRPAAPRHAFAAWWSRARDVAFQTIDYRLHVHREGHDPLVFDGYETRISGVVWLDEHRLVSTDRAGRVRRIDLRHAALGPDLELGSMLLGPMRSPVGGAVLVREITATGAVLHGLRQ